jgi:DEAD/DEAH box helicase domain-containing protein
MRPTVPPTYFDLETLRSADEVGGWGHAERMGLAVGVTWKEGGRPRVYRESEAAELIAEIVSAPLVVGFNVVKFDYEVLRGYAREARFDAVPTVDMLEHVRLQLGHRLSLAHLAAANLGMGKSADGLQSLRWVREGRWQEVIDYCIQDVRVTRELYLRGEQLGRLAYRDRAGHKRWMKVEWDTENVPRW